MFEKTKNKARSISQAWKFLSAEIFLTLPEAYRNELKELDESFQVAMSQFLNDLSHPVLTIAVVGTTSSGKSTLVNLLCGAEIMPIAVQVMTPGAVTIKYSDRKFLEIHETQNASWQCGEWQNISDEEIYRHLYDMMLAYINEHDNGFNSGIAPSVTVHYPFKLKSYLEPIPFSSMTEVKIIDLPGLMYADDEDTLKVIRACREALCLVTYNSAETDRRKVETLLLELALQVKKLEGSPERMLFILNRIDVFRDDRDWPKSEDRFLEGIRNGIRESLSKQMEEYVEEIERIEPLKLSTLPALLALQILSSNRDLSVRACERADKFFNQLIGDEVLDELPRRASKWVEHERISVAKELWKNSYAGEFHTHLNAHISQNFPKLVIPQLIDKFKTKLTRDSRSWAEQTKQVLPAQADYYQECKKIDGALRRINMFINKSSKQLHQTYTSST